MITKKARTGLGHTHVCRDSSAPTGGHIEFAPIHGSPGKFSGQIDQLARRVVRDVVQRKARPVPGKDKKVWMTRTVSQIVESKTTRAWPSFVQRPTTQDDPGHGPENESADNFRAFEQQFDVDDREDVREFIAGRLGLEPLLRETIRQISGKFGEVRCRLCIHRDPEQLESIALVLLIPWRGTVENVIPLMDDLEEWWLDQEPNLTEGIIIDVAFVRD